MFSGDFKNKQITYWVIFLAYALATTFFLSHYARATGRDIALTSVAAAGVSVATITTTPMNENPTAIVETNFGTIEIELFVDKSPITAGNFKKLAGEGFYDGTRFHRVIGGFMIQGGDPLSKDIAMKGRWGTGGPGYAIKDEFIKGLSNVRGTIAMANSGPQSGGSQFFINLADNTFLDWDKEPLTSKHPVFGKVIAGMDVVEKIGKTRTEAQDRPAADVIIETIRIK